MPRLDAARIELLRSMTGATTSIERRIDADLMREFDLPLAWFEVMSALQRHEGVMRVSDLKDVLGELPSSLSRRLDRMEEQDLIEREPSPGVDKRAVLVRLTRDGRSFWRDANVVYRRAVQKHFANVVTESDIVALQRLLSKLTTEPR
jgi:DNA-binding MarR family transcriptional regulator